MERKIAMVDQLPFSIKHADIIVIINQFALVMFEETRNKKGMKFADETSWGNSDERDSTVTNLYIVFNRGNAKQMFENISTKIISQSDLSSREGIWSTEIAGRGWYTGWHDWVTSGGLYDFTIDQAEDAITVTFYRGEHYGNFEYGNGYQKYQYTITIKAECLQDSFSGNSKEFISITYEQIQNQQPY